MRQNHTTLLERNTEWSGAFATEPYEAGWATEALFFVRTLMVENVPAGCTARVQISPDGIHWCDEGTVLPLSTTAGLTFCRTTHFGGWLRLVGNLPDGVSMKVIAYLVLKE